MTDFTEALIPRKIESLDEMLQRLVGDDEQLQLLQRILSGWSRRRTYAVRRDVMTEWSRDEASARAIESVVRRQLVDEVETYWPGAALFSVRLSWHDAHHGGAELARPTILHPSPHPQALFVIARGIVIPPEAP